MVISKTTFLDLLYCPKNVWLKLHKPELAKHFEDIALKNHAVYFDVSPVVATEQSAAGNPATWYPCDGHWTPAGNHYVADALYQYLVAHPTLISR